jgi:hypothetical protein
VNGCEEISREKGCDQSFIDQELCVLLVGRTLKQNREYSPVQCRELNAAWFDEPMVRVVPPRGALEDKLVELHALRGAGLGRRGPYAAWPAHASPSLGLSS